MDNDSISKQSSEYIYKILLDDKQRRNYVTRKDAMILLDIKELSTFRRVDSRLSIDNIILYRCKFYNINSLKSIISKYDILSKDYIGLSEAYTLINRRIANTLERVPTPDCFSIVTHNTEFKSRYLIKRSLVYKVQKASFSDGKLYHKSNMTYVAYLTDEEKKLYITTSESMKIWFIDDFKQFYGLVIQLNVDCIKVNTCTFYNRQSLIDIANKYTKIHKEYITLKEAKDLFGKYYCDQFERILAPPGYSYIGNNFCNPTSINFLVSRKSISKFKERIDSTNGKKSITYLNTSESILYLNVSSKRFIDITKEYNINYVGATGQKRVKLYLRDDLDKIKRMQDEFWNLYIDSSEINKLCNKKTTMTVTQHVETVTTPNYAITFDNFRQCRYKKICYKRDETLKIINEFNTIDTIRSISGNTPFETFKLKFNISSKSYVLTKSTYTIEKWLEFVQGKLSRSLATAETMDYDIMGYIYTSSSLNNLLTKYNVLEVYSLTATQINNSFKEYTTNTCKCLYTFLSQVYQDIYLLSSEVKAEKKFNFDKIIKPLNKDYTETIDTKEEVIYSFETYSEIFKYATNTNFHISRAIDSVEKNGTILYLSTWLYVVLHLNNAWRHGDVSTFPRLNVDDLLHEFGVDDVNWFSKNKLTLTEARKVITRIIHTEFTISKNQANGHFFCSDILAPTVSTIILMIEMFLATENYPYSSTNEPIMRFYSKHNRVKYSVLNYFFNNISLNNFIFRSKKMNKTIMTFIYHIANISGDQDALYYVQYMRSHMSKDSPLFYVKLDYDSINQLSKQLFERGEFGYIPSLLISRLNGTPLEFEEATKQIISVNDTFGSTLKLETTAGFINKIRNEHLMVANIIREKSFEECQIIYTNIFCKNLSSKEEDIQCLVSKEICKYRKLKGGCFCCPYHIPSIYALTTLCRSLLNDLNNYNTELNKARQKQLSTSIHSKLFVFKEAIRTLGKDYVYSCLDLTKEELLLKIEFIPSIEEIPFI